MDSIPVWALFLLLLITQSSSQSMSCTYGPRGSLTSTCVNANPLYFRTTSYRFDNLDETVRCVNCSLQVLESNTFDISGNQIRKLDLTNSQISVLKPKAFIGLVFLERLLMPNNHISTIPAETFQGINKVQELNLENNSIAILVHNGFKELTNLKLLNLRNNHIKSVYTDAFTGLAALEELYLANNDIAVIKDIFNTLPSLRIIDMEGNKVSEIEYSYINELDSLLEFNLAKNLLKNIPEGAFVSVRNLETLNLSSNPIDTLYTGSFRRLFSLEDLDLSNCAISDIPWGAFRELHELRKLDLSNNRITTFTTGTYSGLPELRRLNLAHNKIEAYTKTGVFPLHSLHTLDLSNNNMNYLDYKRLVNHMPSLAQLELENNPWPCYLGKEMEELFRQDNLIFSLGKQFEGRHLTCNDSRPPVVIPPEEPDMQPAPKAAPLVVESNGHQYVLYIFICITLALMAFLFYLQYRNQKEIRDIVGRSNVSEVQLLTSSDMDARDDY